MRKTVDFTVNIPVPGEDPLRGKFSCKTKLSYREMLEQDAIRRQLLGPAGGEPDPVVALISGAVAKIRVHCSETPSWWKENGQGMDFDDINILLAVLNEVNRVEKEA